MTPDEDIVDASRGKKQEHFSKDVVMNRSSHARFDAFKSYLVRGARFSLIYEFPLLQSVTYKTEQALPFEKIYKSASSSHWVHFYTHDRHFECVWNNPERYLPIFQRFAGVITPDFSLYREMPLAMQIWNTYRNRAIAFWLQREGVPIVPNVRWGDERTYSFAFEGLPTGGTVAVGTHGTFRKKLDREYFKKGLDRMVETLQPDTLIVYGPIRDELFGVYERQGVEIIAIPSRIAVLKKEAA